MTLLEKIDCTLLFLSHPQRRYNYNKLSEIAVSVVQVWEKDRAKYGELNNEVVVILKKLIEDGYITPFSKNLNIEPNDAQFINDEFMINFNGLFWLEQGAYCGEMARGQQAERRVREIHNLTIALTVGTLWGALWVCFQMFDYYQNYDLDCQLAAAFVIGVLLASTVLLSYRMFQKKQHKTKKQP